MLSARRANILKKIELLNNEDILHLYDAKDTKVAKYAANKSYHTFSADHYVKFRKLPLREFDFVHGWIKYDEMLKICDRYPYRVPVKGGYENFVSKRIWITSNYGLDKIYRFLNYDKGPLERRMDVIKFFE